MSTHPLLPDPACLTLEGIRIENGVIVFAARTVAASATCPCCAHMSERVHSRYRRTFLDLPWQGNPVRIVLTVRRFFCDNHACERRIFAERFFKVAEHYSRKTCRLAEALRELAFLAGGEAAARIARTFGLLVSPDALLHNLRRSPPTVALPTRVLGVDDFAFRKGQHYGTLLVDMQKHRPVDLLPDRNSDTLATWLKAHPGIEIISRDRAGAYADGARQGAPQAQQVADRWHLLHNAVEALERLLGRHYRHLREAAAQAAQAAQGAAAQITPQGKDSPMGAREGAAQTRAQRLRQERHARRLAHYARVAELQEQGASIRAIAETLCMSRHTVRRIVRADTLADAVPDYSARSPRPNQLDTFTPYLRKRWDEGCHNAAQLFREIKEQGFNGCPSALRPYLARWRFPPPAELGRARGKLPHRPPNRAAPSARTAAWLLLGYKGAKGAGKTTGNAEQQKEQQAFDGAFVERLCGLSDEVKAAQTLTVEFFRIVRERRADALDAWIATAAESQIAEFSGFSAGLSRDRAAVHAGLSLSWSNGQTEGQVNRLKFLKRQMYGRASFDLLRARVLYQAA